MILTLIKSWTNVFGRKYPIGQLMRTDKVLGQFLLYNKIAKEYEGKEKRPPQKVKTDFFKPKN